MTDRYELVYEGKANGVIPVLKYKSKDSGLTVAICQVEGPLVNGYFCLGNYTTHIQVNYILHGFIIKIEQHYFIIHVH